MNPEDLVRSNIRQLRPYRSARQDHLEGILLDANENSFGSIISLNGLQLHRYPDPYQSKLRAKLAELHGLHPENIFVGSGSDEVIDLLIRIFCEPARDSVLIPEPTYGMYRVAANINNVHVDTNLLTDEFQLDVADILEKIRSNTKMIFCCSPNNPTGNLLRPPDIQYLCANVNAIVVVDEAYIEFAGHGSVVPLLREYPNLVVVRTFSKAMGLAGIRLGYCIAHPVVIDYLLKVKAPYNVNSVSATLGLQALGILEERQRLIDRIRSERQKLMNSLRDVSFVQIVYPSDANFLLVRVKNAQFVFTELKHRGIIVRDRSAEPKLENCLRITVGNPAENNILVAAFRELDI